MRKLAYMLLMLVTLLLLVSLDDVHGEKEGFNYPKLQGGLGLLKSFKNGWQPLYRFATFDDDLLRLDGGQLKKGEKEKFWELHHLNTGLAYFTAGDVEGKDISVEWKEGSKVILVSIAGEPWGAVCNNSGALAKVVEDFPKLRSLVLSYSVKLDSIENLVEISGLKYLAVQDCWNLKEFEESLLKCQFDYVEIRQKEKSLSIDVLGAVRVKYMDVQVLRDADCKAYFDAASKALQVRVMWGEKADIPKIRQLIPESLDSFVLYLRKYDLFEAAVDLLSKAKHLKHVGLYDFLEKSPDESKMLLADLSKIAFAYSVELGGEKDYGYLNWMWKSNMQIISQPVQSSNIQALNLSRCSLLTLESGGITPKEFRMFYVAFPPNIKCLSVLQEVEDLYISQTIKGSPSRDLGRLPKVQHMFTLHSSLESKSVKCNPEVFFVNESFLLPDGLKVKRELAVFESKWRNSIFRKDPLQLLRKLKKGVVPFAVCYGYDERRDGELPEIFDVVVVSATKGKDVRTIFDPYPSKVLGKPWEK